MRALALILSCLLASPAAAGPWPREEGVRYLSLTASRDGDGDWFALYGEQGLGRGFTLVFEAGGRPIPVFPEDRRTALSMRWSAPQWRGWQGALSLGVAADLGDLFIYPDPHVKYGASLGRGVETPLGPGWAALDLLTEPGRTGGSRKGFGAVAGLRPAEGWTVELGLYGEDTEEPIVNETKDSSLVLAPAIAREVGPVQLRLGATAGTSGGGLSIGIAGQF